MASSQAAPLSQTKKILLQKETLQTFDKTWLPARVQPPRVDQYTNYGSYLAAYEQYLVALQHMKNVHLKLTRRDPIRAATFTTSRPLAANFPRACGDAAWNLPAGQWAERIKDAQTVPALVFGSTAMLPASSPPATASSAWTTTSASESAESRAPTPTAGSPGTSGTSKASRRAARRRQQRARKARNLERSTQRLNAQTEHVQAERALARALAPSRKAEKARESVPSAAPRRGKHLSPSATRRLAARAAARAEAAAQVT